jgi:hypothetical protein
MSLLLLFHPKVATVIPPVTGLVLTPFPPTTSFLTPYPPEEH